MNSNSVMIVVLMIAAVAIAAIVWGIVRKRRSQKLREHFGPEYDRVVRREGDVRKGEGVLAFRDKRHEKFKLRPLSNSDRSSFLYRWNDVQSRFVDDPKAAVMQADALVTDAMQARGYPVCCRYRPFF